MARDLELPCRGTDLLRLNRSAAQAESPIDEATRRAVQMRCAPRTLNSSATHTDSAFRLNLPLLCSRKRRTVAGLRDELREAEAINVRSFGVFPVPYSAAATVTL